MGQLNVINITSPGRLGVNTETSGADLAAEFGKVANNAVITRDNRLAARKGFEAYAPTAAFTGTVKALFETFSSDGTSEIIWAADAKIYQGYPTRTDITGALTPADSNWKFEQLEDTLFATQAAHAPVAWQRSAGVWVQQTITPSASMTGQNPAVCLSAFGRMWVAVGSANKTTVWFSETLNALNYNTAGAGVLDINDVVLGGDYIVGLGAFGNRLVVFCQHHTLVFHINADYTFGGLEEVIKGIGCVSRDSIVNTGAELVWLAEQGVMSLGRLLQESGQVPVGNISSNVHTAIQDEISSNPAASIKALWWPSEQVLLYLFKSTGNIYCFNARRLGGDAPVVTTWDQLKSISSMWVTSGRALIFGGTDTFFRYNNYGSAEDSYQLAYYSGYLAFGNLSTVKFLKSIQFLLQSGPGQAGAVKWAFDFSEQYESRSFTTAGAGGVVAEFGIAEFDIGEFTAGVEVSQTKVNASRSGVELQIGLTVNVIGDPLEILRMNVQLTTGKQL